MKRKLLLLALLPAFAVHAQTTIVNGGFENWENVGAATEEPTGWNSNKTGGGLAVAGPQTCTRSTDAHSGMYSARVQTAYYILAVVNGSLTTGKVWAPSANKSEGYIAAEGADRMAFIGRPDSLVGWYKYTQATSGTGAADETFSIKAYVHTSNFYDPIQPVNGNHDDASANEIGRAVYTSQPVNQTTWKRFSVPFEYKNGNTPEYIMINITPSSNQTTVAPGSGGTGSTLWIDDVEVVYNAASVGGASTAPQAVVRKDGQHLLIDLSNVTGSQPSIRMVDMTGRIVLTQNLKAGGQDKVLLPHLPAGIYTYQILGGARPQTGKLFLD